MPVMDSSRPTSGAERRGTRTRADTHCAHAEHGNKYLADAPNREAAVRLRAIGDRGASTRVTNLSHRAAVESGDPATVGKCGAAGDPATEPVQPETATRDCYLTVGEIAEIMAMSERQVWRWIDSHELPAHNFERSVRAKGSDFNAFTERCRRPQRANPSQSRSVRYNHS